MLTRFDRYVALGLLTALLGAAVHPGDGRAQGLIPAPAPAQTPAAAPGELKPGERVADLTTRYRFSERYATNEDANNPQAIVQALVGIEETSKIAIDNPRGAPARRQFVAKTIYSERTAELGPDGAVTATVRRYRTYRLTPDFTGAKPTDRRPLEGRDRDQGLRIWYQQQPGGTPLMLSLMADRRLSEREFSIVSKQIFVPALSAVLPVQPSRIGDSWGVPRGAARVLLGGMPLPSTDVMLASFKDLHAGATAGKLVAIFRLTTEKIPFQAEIQFTFERSATPIDDSRGSTYDARGAITELRSAQVKSIPLPDTDGRLRQTETYELILARQLENTNLLELSPKPAPTPDNSWLTYVDPDRRFHFQHPQGLENQSPQGGIFVELVRDRPEGPDNVRVQFQPGTGNNDADSRNRDPELLRKTLQEIQRQERQEILWGSHGWLPKEEWEPLGMKVYRIEAVQRLVTGQAIQVQRRIHLDAYLVVTSRPESVLIHASTLQDPPLEFRKEIEAMIKTFHFGPPEP